MWKTLHVLFNDMVEQLYPVTVRLTNLTNLMK